MKKRFNLLLFIIWLPLIALAQSSSWQAINYQAVALDDKGQAIKNQTVNLRLSLLDNNTGFYFYTESHQLSTDAQGAFTLQLGRGKATAGNWSDIPWEKKAIWMRVEMSTLQQPALTLVSDKKLLAVPYAFHAATANHLIETSSTILEKNQNINWNTSGNSQTRPQTHFLGTTDNKDLTFRTNNLPHVKLTTDGKLVMASEVPAGVESKKESYPVWVNGNFNNQGMWIKLNGNVDSKNNFMTFNDNEGIQGRIEGQTLGELFSSEIWITQTAILALTITSISIETAALYGEASAKFASPYSIADAVAIVLKASNLVAKGISLTFTYGAFTGYLAANVGVTYKSKGADYAEWLQRKPKERDLRVAEVVGIKNGLVSLNTKDADHLKVISSAPVVLGNAPQPDEEDDYEKVAFMGQVPVKVAGPVMINDYILPSGNNDGLAIAVHPQDMKTLDYAKVLGVAWESADHPILNVVTVAVGVNSNDLAPRVTALAKKLDQIEARLGLRASSNLTNSTEATLGMNPMRAGETFYRKLLDDAEFDQYMDQNKHHFTTVSQEIRKRLVADHVDINAVPGLSEMLDNPIDAVKKLRRDPAYKTQWGLIDQKINSKH